MPTLAAIEAVLVGPAPDAGAGLVGGLLARIGYDATGDSPVAALSDAISEALLACGVTPDDVTSPTDADLARLPNSSWPKFRDVAELRLLEIASGGGSQGTSKKLAWDDFTEEMGDAGAEIGGRLAAKRAYALRVWGYGGARLFAGSLRVKPGDACGEF